MELKGVRFVCLIVTIGVINGESLYYKLPKDHDPSKDVRGNSFGLENFLMQVYKEVDSANVDSALQENTKKKENFIRQETHSNRGQTYGLENLAPNLYEFNYEQKNSYVHQTDRELNTELKQEKTEPQVPTNHQQQISENKERRERHKIRKVVKHTRRPVTVTEVSNNIKIHEEFQNEDFKENVKVAEEEHPPSEKISQIAEASYDAPKIQDVQQSEKETDKTTSGQRPRKRITMRRRRKRPTQAKQNPERITLNNAESINEVNETYEIKREEKVIIPLTTALTTTIKSITEKVRLNRTRPIGFRKVNQTEEMYEALEKVETTTEYHDKSEINETNEYTTYLPEITEKSEVSFIASTTINSRDAALSTEETSTDLKTILKQQSESLSLSELLQTQNLSLADFLKNKKEAALFLSGKKESLRITSPRSDVRERNRPLGQNFSSKSRPFTKNRQEEQLQETTLSEPDNSPKLTTTEKSNYSNFVPKNPRNRYGHFKGVYPTIKSLSKSDTKVTITQNNTKTTLKPEINIDFQTEGLSPATGTSEPLNLTKNEQKSTTKRVNDLRLKFRIHRRKFNIFSTTTPKISKEENHENATLMSTIMNGNETSTAYEDASTTEEIQTTKKIGIRIPFKSSNNPELSLILSSKNKTEEKVEKTEKPHDLFTRTQSLKKSHQENEVVKNNEGNNSKQTVITKSPNESTLPIHIIDMDEERESNVTEKSKENSTASSPEEKKKVSQLKRMEVVGKIPPPNEPYKYESRDEILELLKTGSNSEALKLILHARNMTIKELLENREKSSLQSNFSKPFNGNELNLQKRSEIRRTTIDDSDFKVFQSLPDFQPIHKNLLQKTVKELHSNSYPDSLVEESRILPMEVKVPAPIELRGSKQLSNALEIKKKHQFKTDSVEIFDTNEELNRWKTREKPLYYSNPFSIIRERSNPYIRANQEKLSILEKSDNELVESDIILLETIKKSQEANRKLKNNINEILQEQSEIRDLKKETDKLFIPPAVKSAIIASGVVMGLALFVFIAIFAACGWKQRQVRLRAHSSILNDALAKSDSEKKIQNSKSKNQLNSGNFKQSNIYNKSLEVDDESTSNTSTSSNASSYLWNTLKNTFIGRSNMLKKRLGREDKIREERTDGLNGMIRSQDNRRNEILIEDSKEEKFLNPLQKQEERYSVRNSEIHDCIKRSSSFKTSDHFNSWTLGH